MPGYISRIVIDGNGKIVHLREAVTDAVNEWNTKIPNLKLVNDDSNGDTDIDVQLVDGLGGLAAGATMMRFDEDGFMNKATIIELMLIALL